MTIIINGSGTIGGLSAGGLPDASVTTDDIQNNAVTPAKMSRTGTSGQVLTSNGSGADPSYQALPSSGVTSLNGQTGAITDTTFGSIGSYAIAGASGLTASTAYAAGTTVAGSALYYDNTGGGTYGAPLASQGYNAITIGTPVSYGLSGTWRLMCRIGQGSNTGYYPTALWVRVS